MPGTCVGWEIAIKLNSTTNSIITKTIQVARQVESGKVTIHGLGLPGSHPFPKEDMDIQRRNHRNRNRKVITFPRAAWIYEQLIIEIPIQRNTIIGSTVGHIIVIA